MQKQKLTDRQQLMVRIVKRIKFKKENLAKTKKFHREVEADLARKIPSRGDPARRSKNIKK